MTLSLQTHVKGKAKRGGEAQVQRTLPYTRICAGEGPPIFIQGGKFYAEGGAEIKFDDLPDWAGDELALMTAEARREVGLK